MILLVSIVFNENYYYYYYLLFLFITTWVGKMTCIRNSYWRSADAYTIMQMILITTSLFIRRLDRWKFLWLFNYSWLLWAVKADGISFYFDISM